MTVMFWKWPHLLSFLGLLFCFLLIFPDAAEIWITGKDAVSSLRLLWAFNTCLFLASPPEKMRGLPVLCNRMQQQTPPSLVTCGCAPRYLLQTITDGAWVGHGMIWGQAVPWEAQKMVSVVFNCSCSWAAEIGMWWQGWRQHWSSSRPLSGDLCSSSPVPRGRGIVPFVLL